MKSNNIHRYPGPVTYTGLVEKPSPGAYLEQREHNLPGSMARIYAHFAE